MNPQEQADRIQSQADKLVRAIYRGDHDEAFAAARDLRSRLDLICREYALGEVIGDLQKPPMAAARERLQRIIERKGGAK